MEKKNMKYHMRRNEKAISDRSEFIRVIERNNIFTLALCNDIKPYLVTMDYAFDPKRLEFYFHCAMDGKKMDIWKVNPAIWGQIIEDNGYISGECNHAYNTIHFDEKIEFINDIEYKRRILTFMIEQFDR